MTAVAMTDGVSGHSGIEQSAGPGGGGKEGGCDWPMLRLIMSLGARGEW